MHRVLLAVVLVAAPSLALGQHAPAHLPPPSEANYRPAAMMTLADLENIAFHHNPTLTVAAARVRAARGRQVQAGRYPNPVAGYHATEIGNLGTAGQQGGFISQRLVTGGKLRLDQAIAGKTLDDAHFRFHAQEERVLSDVRMSYFNALMAQRRVQLTGQLARIGDDLVTAARRLLEGRVGSENDLLQAEIRAEEAHIVLDNSVNESLEAWRRLAAIVGVPQLPFSPLDGELEADIAGLDWNACITAVLAGNPQLNAARARAARARLVAQRARKEPIPNVDVWVSVRHHNFTGSDVANVQVGVPLPIFDKNRGNIRAAEAEWVAACNDIKRIELQLQDRLAVAYRQYANARQQAERYSQRIVLRAERSLKLVSNGYEKGQVNYLTLLTAQQTYNQVSLAHLDAFRELRVAAAAIEGQLLADSLSQR